MQLCKVANVTAFFPASWYTQEKDRYSVHETHPAYFLPDYFVDAILEYRPSERSPHGYIQPKTTTGMPDTGKDAENLLSWPASSSEKRWPLPDLSVSSFLCAAAHRSLPLHGNKNLLHRLQDPLLYPRKKRSDPPGHALQRPPHAPPCPSAGPAPYLYPVAG